MRFLSVLRYRLGRLALGVADRTVTHPLFSWTWSGSTDARYTGRLVDFRPADTHTVHEMMDGNYLLAGVRVETGGLSPFGVAADSDAWFSDLHSFGWLRHFSNTTDQGQRAFARTLVVDWLGRYGRYDRDAWDVFVTARRVLNWLKALSLLTADAPPDQVRTLHRSIAIQVHALKVRMPLSTDPLARLMAAIALVGAGLSESDENRDLGALVEDLERRLDQQIDADGLVKSRNPHAQIQLLTEIIPVHQALLQRHGQLTGELSRRIEAMNRALNRLVLTTHEPAYFHGCGQVPVELVLAIESQGNWRTARSGVASGYGVLVDGPGKLVTDGGQVPPIDQSGDAHASALAFEYAYGSTLIAGNCGPAPGQLAESRDLFRHTSAHSAPTIDEVSSADLGGGGRRANLLLARQPSHDPRFIEDENTIEMRTEAFGDRYGLALTRRVTLMGGGQTLVGQDRFEAVPSRRRLQGSFSIRFHLAPGVALDRSQGEDLVRLIYRNGEVWAFLWEGAAADIEDSVRHSAHLGLHRTRQIVLHGPAFDKAEIAWVFTKQ
ncbi:heparinase II/III family protein [Pelagibacterium luteolum]|uniref:Uncharacterized conserved protein, heparinase superfamily n=1 Tax=Pelagibacterium luteolum TaxID=440168 RepID=A0A1G7SC79_9HYPH|nr:heparinase II/III family protein [Pelagibacterium luteolum]SDG20512.1 Uncharacterized conserved protein, heparinase superfamily [Pelagibacterium luteolum]